MVCNGEGYLLDYNAACALAECTSAEFRPTGKVCYHALSLMDEPHSVSTDLESLFYSVIDMSSDGHAIAWKDASNEKMMHEEKLCSMINGVEWEEVLSRCREDEQEGIQRLHDMFFEPANRPGWPGWYKYSASANVTASAFIEACSAQYR